MKLSLVEQQSCNRQFAGSIPVTGSNFLMRGREEASRLAHNQEIVGSSPTCATIFPHPTRPRVAAPLAA